MHSAGFANLSYLKSRLMPASALDIEEWDAAIDAVGMGVTLKFEQYCNRSFELASIPADTFAANSITVTLRRYPVMEINSIEIDDVELDVDFRLRKKSGVIEFLTPPGSENQEMAISYQGGFWFPSVAAMPSGATALPADLLESYVAQCQAEIEGRGIFHALGLRKADSTPQPVTGLIDSVKEALNPYRRFSGA